MMTAEFSGLSDLRTVQSGSPKVSYRAPIAAFTAITGRISM